MRCPTLTELPAPPPGKTGWPWTEESAPAPDRTPVGDPWPRISIVTPSYNQGTFIEETIRSVLLQGYPDLEYIIIDGGSSDESVEIIRRYAPWLTYWVSEPDKGQAQAINKGFKYAGGDIFGYLNSDDIYFPSGLCELIAQARKKIWLSPCILASPVEDFGDSGIMHWHANSHFGRLDKWLDGGVSLHQPGILWTRILWEQCGPFREELNYTFDRFFFTSAFINKAVFFSSLKTMAGFRIHAKSKTFQFFLIEDRFCSDWDNARPDLEAMLKWTQQAALSFRRNLAENWRLVGLAMSSEPVSKEQWDPLVAKLKREPWWLLHRPVAASLLRLSRIWIKQLKTSLV